MGQCSIASARPRWSAASRQREKKGGQLGTTISRKRLKWYLLYAFGTLTYVLPLLAISSEVARRAMRLCKDREKQIPEKLKSYVVDETSDS